MKNKNLIFNIVTVLVPLLLIVPMFLNLFGFNYYLGEHLASTGNFGLFANYENVLQNPDINALPAIIFDICLIAAVALAAILLVVVLLEFAGVKFNFSKVKTIIGFLFVLLFVVALVVGVVHSFVNSTKGNYVTFTIFPQVGFYVAVALMFVSGALCFVSSMLKPAKKKRK